MMQNTMGKECEEEEKKELKEEGRRRGEEESGGGGCPNINEESVLNNLEVAHIPRFLPPPHSASCE